MEAEDASANWETRRGELWGKISVLTPTSFQNNVWSQIKLQ